MMVSKDNIIILNIVLQLSTVFSTVTCVSTLYDGATKSPNNTFLWTYPRC